MVEPSLLTRLFGLHFIAADCHSTKEASQEQRDPKQRAQPELETGTRYAAHSTTRPFRRTSQGPGREVS